MAIPNASPTPVIFPRLPDTNENGMDTSAMINANNGTENFL